MKMKDRIIKVYHETTRKAFEKWRTLLNGMKLEKSEFIMME